MLEIYFLMSYSKSKAFSLDTIKTFETHKNHLLNHRLLIFFFLELEVSSGLIFAHFNSAFKTFKVSFVINVYAMYSSSDQSPLHSCCCYLLTLSPSLLPWSPLLLLLIPFTFLEKFHENEIYSKLSLLSLLANHLTYLLPLAHSVPPSLSAYTTY